ncbi:Omp28-related outer membrane protein [Flavobacterium rhizosphaerae]|uniref:Omp28-related outer membrane protein n=1 Tax=Flavobacterium rhizosphaerae TaxID=3163298 RepID=A0ABW8YWK0_9FLAO
MKKYFILLLLASLFIPGCSSDYTILDSIGSINLTADNSNKVVGETITFTVKDDGGQDITEDAVLYVDGSPIDGNTFSSNELGSHEVIANFSGVESLPLTITFGDPAEVNFVKRLLVEDYTGTWCGFCPRVAYAVEQLNEQTDKAVIVAIHRPSSNVSSINYDPYNYDTSVVEDIINVPSYPKGMLNRMTQWTFPEPANLAQAIALTQGENPKLGLALKPVVNGSTIDLEVDVKFSKNFTGLKLVVYILENGLIYEQHNYTEYYNDVDVIEDYEHNHVLRSCLTPLLGEAISNTTIGNTFTKSFSVSMPASVENSANIEFVAFVIDAAGNALNVRKAVAGENQDFEEL